MKSSTKLCYLSYRARLLTGLALLFLALSAFDGHEASLEKYSLENLNNVAPVFATITVTSAADNTDVDGLVTLREAIIAAETDSSVDGSETGLGSDVIVFDPSIFSVGDVKIVLTVYDEGLDMDDVGPTAFKVTSDISIIGPSDGNGISLFATASRLFYVTASGSLTLKNLTLENGIAKGGDGGDGHGGGGGGAAGMGGAIFNQGMLDIDRCAFLNNIAQGGEGGTASTTGSDRGEGGGGGGLGEDGDRGDDQQNRLNPAGGDPNGGAHGTNPGGFGGGGGGAYASDQGGDGGFGGGAGGGGYRACGSTNCSVTAGSGALGGFGGGGSGGGGSQALGVPTAGHGGNGGFGGGGGSGGSYNDTFNDNGSAGTKGTGGEEGGDGADGTGGENQHGGIDRSGHGGGGAGMGGAIFSHQGMVSVSNTTFCGNEAIGGTGGGGEDATTNAGGAGAAFGGALFNYNSSITVTNCTLSDNAVSGGVSGDGSVTSSQGGAKGGAVYNLGDGATASIVLNNTIAANSVGSDDLVGNEINTGTSTFSGENNIVGASSNVSGLTGTISSDPLLETLGDNGGPTMTKAIGLGSPALDAGINGNATGDKDQRDGVFLRIYDGDNNSTATVDIGAYEKVLIDYGDAPDNTTGVGLVPVLHEDSTDMRLSDAGSDLETDASIRDNFRPNSAAIAYNATDDEYMVVWQTDDDTLGMVDNELEIMGARINASTGLKIGGDFRISDMGPNAVTTAGASNPAIAWNSVLNQYLVVWNGDDFSGLQGDNEFEIYGQLLDNTGAQIDTNDFRISSAGEDGLNYYDALSPAVAFNAVDNQYLVVWHGTDTLTPLVTQENEIFGQLIDGASADEIGTDFRISDMGDDAAVDMYDRQDDNASSPSVAWNSTDNEYFVVWQGSDDEAIAGSSETEIWGQLLDSDGAEIGTNDFRISFMGPDNSTRYQASYADVAYNATDNQYLVTWHGDHILDGDDDVWAQKIGNGGSLEGSALLVSTLNIANANFDFQNAAVSWNLESNEYAVSFQGDDDSGGLVDGEIEIYLQRIGGSGLMVGSNTRVSDMGPDGTNQYAARNPDIAYRMSTSDYCVVWYGDDDTAPLSDGENEIFKQLLTVDTLTNFATNASNDGPAHVIDQNIYMGDTLDAEIQAMASDVADGDDADDLDDEDGVSDPTTDFIAKSGGGVEVSVLVTNNTGSMATLYGWIDFDQDGVFANDGIENASVTVEDGSMNASATLEFVGTAGDPTFARFRFSTDVMAASPTGGASDGEVEDYQILSYATNCADTLHVDNALISTIMSPGVLSASRLITSDATLAGASDYTYRSGTDIELQPNFTVPEGTLFITLKEDCAETSKTNPLTGKTGPANSQQAAESSESTNQPSHD